MHQTLSDHMTTTTGNIVVTDGLIANMTFISAVDTVGSYTLRSEVAEEPAGGEAALGRPVGHARRTQGRAASANMSPRARVRGPR